MGMSTAFLAVLWAVRSVASFEEIWDAVVGSCLYSQTPLQFWRVMAGCIAIGLLATAVHWFVFFILHEPIMCSYNCMIEICFSWRGKTFFSQTKRRFLDAVLVPISQGTEVTIVTEHVLSPFSIGSTLSISRAQEFEFTTATVLGGGGELLGSNLLSQHLFVSFHNFSKCMFLQCTILYYTILYFSLLYFTLLYNTSCLHLSILL